jgi:mRNA-degrading endonuclease RelE of RelBE toxin-antitoxin system
MAMQFLLADSFQTSLDKLNVEEQKAAKLAAFELQINPANPGLQCHRLDSIKDKNFWSARASRDIRLIFHRVESSAMLCYVDHHDPAYDWASRRKIETHPVTGAAQIVEIRETVREIQIPLHIPAAAATAAATATSAATTTTTAAPEPRRPLSNLTEADLLSYGVPAEWIPDVRTADDDMLLVIASHLPGEAAEAIIDLATGTTPTKPEVRQPDQSNPYEHPDAQRRFRVLTGTEELARALDYPWERWIVFLHPSQADWVSRSFNGPTRVQGSAGTGKTVVALHRAVHLARRNPEARVLLTTFSEPLAALLQDKLHRLVQGEPTLLERLDVLAMQELGERMHAAQLGKPQLIAADDLRALIQRHAPAEISRVYGEAFVVEEFNEIVNAFGLRDWDSYRHVRRLGRKSRLNEAKRRLLWDGFAAVLQELERSGQITSHQLFHRTAEQLHRSGVRPYQHIVVDECQDITAAQLRLLAALAGTGPDALFFAGDLGQRIFQQPFSWTQYGVDIRGRSRTLRINYRTSHQIRCQADQLLDPETRDVDGNVQDRRGAISVFNGPEPDIRECDDTDSETKQVAAWIEQRRSEGLTPREFGIFVRSEAEITRAESALQLAELPYERLQPSAMRLGSRATLSTMHLAKGLEFRAVIVMACDEDVIPNAERIKAITDDSDLDEVVATERHLLYVACTRARDHLLITSGDTCSEFVEDLLG